MFRGGAADRQPVIQDYRYLNLTPIGLDVNLQEAISKQNICVSVPALFTVDVNNKPTLMNSAAERILVLDDILERRGMILATALAGKKSENKSKFNNTTTEEQITIEYTT